MKSFRNKILLLGSTGFLGSSLKVNLQAGGLCVETVDRTSFDLSKPFSPIFCNQIKSSEYQYVLICAALSDVEKCFQDPVRSNQINVKGTLELLNLIFETKSIPVFFSSDYVFSNTSVPRSEQDLRAPETCYGRQKLLVEQYLESQFERYLIFRTSKLMSKTAHPRNILKPMIDAFRSSKPMGCFEDQWLNPVFVEDIAKVLSSEGFGALNGVYHLGTRRIFTRYELGHFLANSLGFDPTLIKPTRMSEMQFSELRPTHNTLDCRKIEESLPFRFTEIEDVLRDLKALTV